MPNVPHEYGPSRLNHGEAQCKWCLGTNRELAIISPNHCETRAASISRPIYTVAPHPTACTSLLMKDGRHVATFLSHLTVQECRHIAGELSYQSVIRGPSAPFKPTGVTSIIAADGQEALIMTANGNTNLEFRQRICDALNREDQK